MVSSKSLIGLAAFVVLAAVSSSVVATGSVDVKILVSTCSKCYDNFGLNLSDVLGEVGGLVKNVLNLVDGLVGGLLGGLLDKLGLSGNVSIDGLLKQPTSKGNYIDLCLKLVMTLHPVLEKASPELGNYLVKAVFGLLSVVINEVGEIEGCTLIKSLNVDLNQLISELGLDTLLQNWKGYYAQNGGCGGAKGEIFECVNSLFGVLGNVVGGLGLDDLLSEILFQVYGVVGLLGNVVDDALTDILNFFGSCHQKYNCGGDFTSYQQTCVQRYTQYDSSCYSQVFTSS